ncbi:MAG: CBASS oligonucleotide cyclase [Kiritimatiellae bacterium]|nr:CBASS oligonucleotide cyclase [Kiritimatiellia bacterium]
MGSSGGFFSSGIGPSNLRRQVQQANDLNRSDEFVSNIAAILDSYLANANKRDSTALTKHVQEIIDALEKDIEGSVSLLFGGSLAKSTYVNGLSDVDALVFINRSELIDKSPSDVQTYFAKCLRQRFQNTEIHQGSMAVTVIFNDMEVQLLPAIRTKTGLRLSLADGSAWSDVVRPDKFASKLTDTNQHCSGKLVPTVKLAKLILAKLPENHQLTGYHIESLAVRIFDEYAGPFTTKAMLRRFFIEAPNHLLSRIGDSTGQSFHVDDYLGSARSLKRRIVADTIARIGRTIQNADAACSVNQWRDVLE